MFEGQKTGSLLKPDDKIVSLGEAENLAGELRDQGKKLVFTNGCFDLIHWGHAWYLFEARCLGDFLVIGLNSDDSVNRLKGEGRPILSHEERARLLASLYFVDQVIIFEEDTPYNLISALQPHVLVKGGDWRVDEIVGGELVSAKGGKVLTLPFVEGLSTSNIIEKIRQSKPGP